MNDEVVLCGANSYNKKYYINAEFGRLPEAVKQEMKTLCILFTEDVGGIMTLEFDEEGSLKIKTRCEEGDLLFDEIGSELKIKQLIQEKKELFESLEMYYKVWRK